MDGPKLMCRQKFPANSPCPWEHLGSAGVLLCHTRPADGRTRRGNTNSVCPGQRGANMDGSKHGALPIGCESGWAGRCAVDQLSGSEQQRTKVDDPEDIRGREAGLFAVVVGCSGSSKCHWLESLAKADMLCFLIILEPAPAGHTSRTHAERTRTTATHPNCSASRFDRGP